ncbi:MAG: TolC family protein [Planctomycetota bacterium]|nr:TolC family protein [Planctomycetota bacterium]
MTHLRFLLAAACAAAAATTLAAAAEDLLEANLAQARSIVPAAGKPASDDALAKLKAEVMAKQKVWAERLARPATADELLKGLPESALTQAHDLAADSAKTAAALRSGVTLELLLALAPERNPEVRVAYQNWRATTRRFEQAWYLEELVATYRAFVRELDTKVGPRTHKEMPGMTFAFPSVLALKGEVIDADADIAWLNYRLALRKALNEVARGFVEVQYTKGAIANLRETKALFSQMAQSAQARLEAGKASQADALKAQSELAIVETRLVTMERERTNRIAQVNSMLALPVGAEWGACTETDLAARVPSLDDALSQARAGNQKLLAARKDVELMQLMVRMAETEVLPRASVGYSQVAPSVGADAGPTRSMMAVFPERQEVNAEQAPFGVNAAYIDELRVKVQAARAMQAAAEAETDFGVKNALFMLDASQRNQQTYKERVVPQSKQAFDTAKAQYGSGNSPFIELLDAGRSYLENTLMLEGARRDRNKSVIDLQDAVGASAAPLAGKRAEDGGR